MTNHPFKFYSIAFFLLFATANIFAQAQAVKYTDGHNSWNPDSLGNHRAVVQFNGNSNIAKASIEWRRRDVHPELKRIIVQDAKTGNKILNVKLLDINRETGNILFEPVSGKGDYYIYYMPYKYEGPHTYYPKGVYYVPENTADENWLTTTIKPIDVNCTVKEIQSINAFNSFYPMEVIATSKETKALLAKNSNRSFLVFPEDREHSIRMKNDLPQRWIIHGPKKLLNGAADRGEYFAFQLGVYAIKNLHGVQVHFTDLKNATSKTISAKHISCINTDGTKYDGSIYRNTVNVEEGKVQALWCGIDVPESTAPGIYSGKATVQSAEGSETVTLQIKVSNNVTYNGGIDHPEKMTRLKWLNSTMVQENKVIAPYTPLTVTGNTISMLGRKLLLNVDGLPAQIQTFFIPEMTSIGDQPNNLLTAPAHFHFIDNGNKESLVWKNSGVQFISKEDGTVSWKASNTSPALQMNVQATLEFDGFLQYHIQMVALQDAAFNELSFHLPIQKTFAKYLMGLGLKGGLRPDSIQWKWDVAHKNQDGAWIGNVNAGLQFSLRDEHYTRPLNTNFYLQKPLLLPTSWGNENKGGINIYEDENAVLINAYSGSRNLKKGDTLYYNINVLITPFHPINTDFQWSSRFFHAYKPIDTIAATGATTVNIHHATAINPYINYPFIEYKKMKDYIDSAHNKGLKVKIYNTIRELSNKAYEIHALRSLGHEIFSSGKGGGFSWLQEHLGDDYIAAWFVPELKDAAIVNSGMNRWHNYYVEGMNWLVQNVGIDGIYLDDVAFDRVTMKRIKRLLTQDGHPGILDLHSANQYNKNDGFNNSANLYMEHFPYLNKLWFGEYFDYEKNDPDFFLTEVCGIPFGLMGEMLEKGGNPWRGMIYGMTNRMPWSDNADPRPIWKAWDDFGIKGSEMIGYWSDRCPVKTSNAKVLATVYKKKDAAMISIASWAAGDTSIQLKIDWTSLGIDPSNASITAPEISNFQPAKTFNVNDFIPVEKNKGWLLIIQTKK